MSFQIVGHQSHPVITYDMWRDIQALYLGCPTCQNLILDSVWLKYILEKRHLRVHILRIRLAVLWDVCFFLKEFEQSVADRVTAFVGADCQQLYRDVELIREWLNKPPEGKENSYQNCVGNNINSWFYCKNYFWIFSTPPHCVTVLTRHSSHYLIS